MKRVLGFFLVLGLCVSLLPATALAASASADFTAAPSDVLPGETYAYAYCVRYTSCCYGRFTVDVGGVFEKVSGGESDFFDAAPDNITRTYTGSVTVRVRADAAPGQEGRVSIGGQAMEVGADLALSAPETFSGSFSAKVAGGPSATPKPLKKPKPKQKTALPLHEPLAETPASSGRELAGSPTEWDLIHSRFDTLEPGGAMLCSVTQSPRIPLETLRALKAKQGLLELDFGAYSCMINGACLGDLPEDTGALDLSMSVVRDAALSPAPGGAAAYRLQFAHTGPLPGVFTYRFPAAQHSPGDALYLYDYNADTGALEGKLAALVSEDGCVSFDIRHGSRYFVTSTPIADATGALTGVQSLSDEAVPVSGSQAPPVSPLAWMAALLGAALLTAFIILLVRGKNVPKSRRHAE